MNTESKKVGVSHGCNMPLSSFGEFSLEAGFPRPVKRSGPNGGKFKLMNASILGPPKGRPPGGMFLQAADPRIEVGHRVYHVHCRGCGRVVQMNVCKLEERMREAIGAGLGKIVWRG